VDSPATHLHLPFLLRRCRVNILHVPYFYAPAIIPCPLIITVHDLTSILGRTVILQRGRSKEYWLARRALNRAKRIVAVSQATRRELCRLFDLPESKIKVVYNALDERLTHDHEPPDQDRVLQRYQVDYPYLLYAGNIRPQKNVPRLIEAFAVLKAELANHPRFANLKLIVIGDELSKHPELRRTVTQTHLRQDVRFLGFVPYQILRVFYRRAEAFVFPSLQEGFGLPPLEAMAHGTPVVTSNVSSLPEVVGQAAVQVNPENVFEIARGIRQVLLDEATRREVVAQGFEQVKRFSWERAAMRVRDLYLEVAAS
jgi:glycosyltransferase involved in cell wall biosynthesis